MPKKLMTCMRLCKGGGFPRAISLAQRALMVSFSSRQLTILRVAVADCETALLVAVCHIGTLVMLVIAGPVDGALEIVLYPD